MINIYSKNINYVKINNNLYNNFNHIQEIDIKYINKFMINIKIY